MSEDLTKDLPSSDGEKLTQILSILERLDSRLGSLEQKVEGLEEKLEERLFDTRPIWEKVDSDIVQQQAGQQRLEDGLHRLQEGQQNLQASHQVLQEVQESLRGEAREVRTALRDIFRKLSIFNDTLVSMQTDYRDIYDRIREIERQR